jgi:hypothetical protein
MARDSDEDYSWYDVAPDDMAAGQWRKKLHTYLEEGKCGV